MPSYKDLPDEQYDATFSGEPLKDDKLNNAFQIAHDTRRFEIELYWKRSAYFWAFVAAAFAGYFALRPQTGDTDSFTTIGRILISALGMAFCYAWHLVSRASKFWQENWEQHINFLEDKITGPLYKTIRNPPAGNFLFPFEPFPLSVSKINMLLSFVLTLSWWIPLGMSLTAAFLSVDLPVVVGLWLLPGFWLGILTILFFAFGRTSIRRPDGSDTLFIIRDKSGE